jgi:predicted lipoprotein with Yx(FWY)xxD motif
MKKIYWMVGWMLIAILALSACQAEPPPPAARQAPQVEEQPMDTPEVSAPIEDDEEDAITLQTARDAELGRFLVDENGMTLYMFTLDEAGKSNCDAGCLAAWPPLLADRDVVAGDGVDASLIGQGDMLDGRTIITYNGMPLYYWAADANPGDTTGQGFGDVWFVVAPDGSVPGVDAVPTTGSEVEEAAPVMGDDAVMVNIFNHPRYGPILVDSEGMTLYIFTMDEPNRSNCLGECLAVWPPLITDGEAAAGEGVNEMMLGTADLNDGRLIVTYDRMPLYYWIGDTQRGDTNGQNFNNVWFVISPDGNPVFPEKEEKQSTSPYSYPDY